MDRLSQSESMLKYEYAHCLKWDQLGKSQSKAKKKKLEQEYCIFGSFRYDCDWSWAGATCEPSTSEIPLAFSQRQKCMPFLYDVEIEDRVERQDRIEGRVETWVKISMKATHSVEK